MLTPSSGPTGLPYEDKSKNKTTSQRSVTIRPWITKLIQPTESQTVSFFKTGLLSRQGAAWELKYLDWQTILLPLIRVTVAPAGPGRSGFHSLRNRCNHKYAKQSADSINTPVFCLGESRGLQYLGKHSLYFYNKVHGKCRVHKNIFVLGPIYSI